MSQPDRRENTLLERVAALEQRVDHSEEGRREQGLLLVEINKQVTTVLIRLEEYAQRSRSLDSAHGEIRRLHEKAAQLEIKLKQELPQMRTIQRIVYSAVGLLVLAGLAAWGLVKSAP